MLTLAKPNSSFSVRLYLVVQYRQNHSLRIKLFTTAKNKKNVLLQGPDRQGSPVDPALTQRPVTPAPPEWSSYDAPINFTWVQCLSFLLHHLPIFSSHTQQQKVNLVKTPVNSSPLYSIFFQLSGDPRRVVWDGMAKESRPGAENLCDIY